MAASSAEDKFVTWKAYLSSLLILTAMFTSAGAWAWATHAAQPHTGVINAAEYGRNNARMDSRLNRIEDKVDQLLNRGRPPE